MKHVLKKTGWIIFVATILVLSFLSAGAAEKVQYGGTLTYCESATGYNPMSWDAADWTWMHGNTTGHYMEHLLMGDLQKGPRGSNKFGFTNSGSYLPYDVVRGELAEKWEVKKDPLSIVYYLRKGVMWQDKPGIMTAREFVASDVVYSLNRIKNSRRASPKYLDFIDRYEAKDKYTVVMYLKEWNPDWGYYVGWGFYDAIQAPEQEKAPGGPGQWKNACGTGPFMLEEYINSHSVRYMKNPNYWDTETIAGKKYKIPFVDRAVSMIMKDEATMLTALRTGKLDMVGRMGWRAMEEMKKTTPELIWNKSLDYNTTMLSLRFDRKPFGDIRVRRALNMAIDRIALGKTFYGGNVEYLTLPYPYYFKTVYTPIKDLPPAAKELFTYDPAKAKKLLADAGYPNGFTFKCQYGGASSQAIDYLSMIAAYFEKIGVKMEIDVMDQAAAFTRMVKRTHHDATLYPTDFGSPLTMIRKIFGTGQTWNASMISDKYIDETLDKLNSDPKMTEKQRDAELKKLGVYALEKVVPGVLLVGPYNYTARWPWVKNYYGELRVGAHRAGPIYARIWIDQELKKKMGY